MSTTWRDALRATLADYRVSRSEKSALKSLLADESLSEADIALLRSEAFSVARAETESPDTVNTLQWLEGVMRLLAQVQVASPPQRPTSQEGTAFFSPGPECLRAIQQQVRGARHKLEICVFTITDNRITEAIEAAIARRVQVRIISDDMKTDDAGSDIQRLHHAGAEVRVDVSPYHMHHKFAIIDNKTLLTGSYNWTRAAAEHNEENLVRLNDLELTRQFQQEFAALWSRCADWT